MGEDPVEVEHGQCTEQLTAIIPYSLISQQVYSIEEFIIAVYCCVDDTLNQLTQTIPTRSRGFQPAISGSEVLAMEIVAEYQGIDTDKGIWSYFRRHWQHLFPQLLSRSNFVRHSANLWQYKQQLQKQLATSGPSFLAIPEGYVRLSTMAIKLHIA